MSFTEKIDNAVIRSFMGLSITDQPYYVQKLSVLYFIKANFIFSALSLTIISWLNDVEISGVFIATAVIIALYILFIELILAHSLTTVIFIIARKKPYKIILRVILYSFIPFCYLVGFYINFYIVIDYMDISPTIYTACRIHSFHKLRRSTNLCTASLILVVFIHCILTFITNIINIKSRTRHGKH